jgi:hypothetical protein
MRLRTELAKRCSLVCGRLCGKIEEESFLLVTLHGSLDQERN